MPADSESFALGLLADAAALLVTAAAVLAIIAVIVVAMLLVGADPIVGRAGDR